MLFILKLSVFVAAFAYGSSFAQAHGLPERSIVCCSHPAGDCFKGECIVPNIPYPCCLDNGTCCPQQTLEERVMWHRETLMKLTALDDKDEE